MVNTLVTPSALLAPALANLQNKTVMLPLIYRDETTAFSTQKIGNTANVKRPATFVSNTFDRATGIIIQDINETTVPVVLDTIEDVSFAIDIEDLTLKVSDFDQRLLQPAMEALAQKVDKAILAKRSAITAKVGDGTSAHVAGVPEVLIDAGLILNKKSVPLDNRAVVIGPELYAQWLDRDMIKFAEHSGSTQALREANIGPRLFGFDPYWTQNVVKVDAVGQPASEVGLAFHRDAFAFASAPLETPPGSNAAVRQYKGLSVRIAWGYNQEKKRTVVSVDTLFGVSLLDANLAVKIQAANRTV